MLKLMRLLSFFILSITIISCAAQKTEKENNDTSNGKTDTIEASASDTGSKTNDSAETNQNTQAKKNSQDKENITEVVFNAQTRGRSENITVVNYNVYHKTQSSSKTHTINNDSRKSLEDEVLKLNLDHISSLKPPTNKRHFDGALIARVTIKIGKKIYVSSDFDHDNPPTELAPLVNLLKGFTTN